MESDQMELDVLQASQNLSKYQEETRRWRDKKVVDKFVNVGDWVLKRKPNAETIGKLLSKWDRPYLVLYSNIGRVLSTSLTSRATSCNTNGILTA